MSDNEKKRGTGSRPRTKIQNLDLKDLFDPLAREADERGLRLSAVICERLRRTLVEDGAIDE